MEWQKWKKLFEETQGVDGATERQTTTERHHNKGSDSEENLSDEDSRDSKTSKDKTEIENLDTPESKILELTNLELAWEMLERHPQLL